MLTLFNTLNREKEEFKPLTSGKVGLYTCGPTVYDYAHIGNLRSYIFSDVLYRALKLSGYDVKSVMNITDVDDKTIKRSQTENKSLKELTEFYTQIFLEDLVRINVIKPNELPKATDYIQGMVELIKILLEKGVAYKTDRGDVYFAIAKAKNYGEIAQLASQELKENASGRITNADEYEKDDARDFALWKAYNEDDGNVFWETEIGKGRPGWHIECSVMSTKILGQPFDIHVGGVDLIFPHHTNEIAQSEAAYDKSLANFWLHPEHLLVDNSKMSKSKNNFYTSKDILDNGFDPLAFRYLTLTSHYRSKLNFTWDSLKAAQNALNNLYQNISVLDKTTEISQEFKQTFDEAINDDLNTPQAIAVMWDLIKSDLEPGVKLATLCYFDEIFGLKIIDSWEAASLVPDIVKNLAKERDLARQNKDFSKSDELRLAIESNGYIVEDTPDGTRVKKKY